MHRRDVTTWKTNHAAIFEANPQYLCVESRIFSHDASAGIDDPEERVSTVLLKKLTPSVAYPNSGL
jgi:hypothetical protein